MKAKLFVSILVLLMVAGGCAKAPTEQMTAAESAVTAAAQSEAEIYAPQAMAAARDSLASARMAVEEANKSFGPFRRYGKATALLAQAQQAAEQAAQEAQANKAQAKSEVEALVTQATAGIDSAATMLSFAPAGKDNRADLELMKADLEAMRASLAEVQSLYQSGRYLDAKTKAEVLTQQLDTMNSELAAATSTLKGRKS